MVIPGYSTFSNGSMRSSSISWVSIHFDGSSSSIGWISVHCNVTTMWILLFSVIIIHCNLFLELIAILVIQAGHEDTAQCSNNKGGDKCDHYTDSYCCSGREFIITQSIITNCMSYLRKRKASLHLHAHWVSGEAHADQMVRPLVTPTTLIFFIILINKIFTKYTLEIQLYSTFLIKK